MPSQDSVTHWLDLLQAGDHAAVQPLWERYFGQLVLRARAALRGQANTARKAYRLLRDAARHKRGGGKVKTEADLPDPEEADDEGSLAQVVGREPTPEFAAQVAEEC
jgi:hypothetical protein